MVLQLGFPPGARAVPYSAKGRKVGTPDASSVAVAFIRLEYDAPSTLFPENHLRVGSYHDPDSTTEGSLASDTGTTVASPRVEDGASSPVAQPSPPDARSESLYFRHKYRRLLSLLQKLDLCLLHPRSLRRPLQPPQPPHRRVLPRVKRPLRLPHRFSVMPLRPRRSRSPRNNSHQMHVIHLSPEAWPLSYLFCCSLSLFSLPSWITEDDPLRPRASPRYWTNSKRWSSKHSSTPRSAPRLALRLRAASRLLHLPPPPRRANILYYSPAILASYDPSSPISFFPSSCRICAMVTVEQEDDDAELEEMFLKPRSSVAGTPAVYGIASILWPFWLSISLFFPLSPTPSAECFCSAAPSNPKPAASTASQPSPPRENVTPVLQRQKSTAGEEKARRICEENLRRQQVPHLCSH